MKKTIYLFSLFLLVFATCTEEENTPEPIDNDGDGYFLERSNYPQPKDCDDSDPNVNPGVKEIRYNGIDDDCNPLTLDDDLDQDGFNRDADCDDNDPTINPNAIEIPYNGIDDDCDPLTLDNDLDGDGYTNEVDCDDTNADVNPGAEEIFTDDIDNNCNGVVGYIEPVSIECSSCSSGSGKYYKDNARSGRQCKNFDSDEAAALAGFSTCAENAYID